MPVLSSSWDVADVRVTDDNALWVRFRDGTEGTVRFTPSAFRGVFSRLGDQEQFRQVTLVDGVVTWPGDLELSPNAMRRAIAAEGEWILT